MLFQKMRYLANLHAEGRESGRLVEGVASLVRYCKKRLRSKIPFQKRERVVLVSENCQAQALGEDHDVDLQEKAASLRQKIPAQPLQALKR